MVILVQVLHPFSKLSDPPESNFSSNISFMTRELQKIPMKKNIEQK
jgi:hypothetical protein